MGDDLRTWYYIVNHIFFPPKLPQKNDHDMIKEHAISVLLHDSAQAYQNCLVVQQKPR
jgi:hypothetical protein